MSCGESDVGYCGYLFRSTDRPSSYEQFWLWVRKALPRGDQVGVHGWTGCDMLGNMESKETKLALRENL
jgi:hypothetical protein